MGEQRGLFGPTGEQLGLFPGVVGVVLAPPRARVRAAAPVLPPLPARVRARLVRRIARPDGYVGWRHEVLVGTVQREWSDAALVRFDGRKRDGSARGCLVLVERTDLIQTSASARRRRRAPPIKASRRIPRKVST